MIKTSAIATFFVFTENNNFIAEVAYIQVIGESLWINIADG